jgi:hypothetical protein
MKSTLWERSSPSLDSSSLNDAVKGGERSGVRVSVVIRIVVVEERLYGSG